MSRLILRWSVACAVACTLAPRLASAQAPTIDTGPSTLPGTGGSLLGRSPGSGSGSFNNLPGAGEMILGGRPGASTPRVPTTVSNPGGTGGVDQQQMGIAAPRPKPFSTAPI